MGDFKELIMKEKNIKPEVSKLEVIDANTNEGTYSCIMRNALSETTSFHIYRIHRRDGHDTAEQERIRHQLQIRHQNVL